MSNIKITEELPFRLKQRFGKKVSDLNPREFEVYNMRNQEKCPWALIRMKIGKKPKTIYFVNEMKNMVLAGKQFGENVTLNTVLYLDGRDGYKVSK